MEKVLAKIREITSDPYSYMSLLKDKTGKKIVGCFPMYVPEELIYAADMIPVVIWRGNEPVTWGHAHVPPYNCGITRSFVDDAVRGKLSFMDGMVFHVRQCLQAGEFPLIMEKNVKPDYMWILYFPPIYDGKAVTSFLLDDLKAFIKSLESFTGTSITEEKMINSIAIYNENRSLLQKIYEIRRKNPKILKAKEVMQIVWSSMLMPKKENNELLKELIRAMEKSEVKSSSSDKIKVIPVGCLCQTLQFHILDMIEELGMIMPDDDFYVGSRYFANRVELDGRSPVEAIADRYMKKTPVCPTKSVWQVHWADEITKKVKDNKAQGVISIIVKYCPPHSCYYPDFKSVLEKNNIPQTMIQMEHEVISLESIKTRLQSFAEILGGV